MQLKVYVRSLISMYYERHEIAIIVIVYYQIDVDD